MEVAIPDRAFVPPRNYVPRPRLDELIDRGVDEAPVLLVRAPAVSGKTTMLRAWQAATSGSVRYVSVDAVDLSSGRAAHTLFKALLADLDPDHRTVLILDSTSACSDPEACAYLGELLLDLPDSLRVILSLRAEPDPNMRVGLLRARGQLAEIRSTDLAFTPEEMAQFLAPIVELDTDQVADLHERTEGWVGGVTLAGLALLRSSDKARVLSGLTGNSRYIAELLAAEVLEPQPEEVRDFLLATSVLDTMDGALADAVTGGSTGAAQLDRLERSGMFVEPTNDQRSSFRYWPLFREFLGQQLHTLQPDREVAAHRGAAGEYEQRGDIGPAIAHFVRAGDDGAALRLVLTHGERVAAGGDVDTLRGWIGLLPTKERGDAAGMLAVARLCVTVGMLEEAAVWLDAVRWRVEDSDDVGLRALHALLLGYVQAARGNFEAVLYEAERALALVASDPTGRPHRTVRGRAQHLLAAGHVGLDHLDEAQQAQGVATPDAVGFVSSNAYGGWLAFRRGYLDQAMSYSDELIAASELPWHKSTPLVVRGAVERERNQLDVAEADLLAGIESSRRWSRLSVEVVGSVELALLRYAQFRETDAFAELTRIRPRVHSLFMLHYVAAIEATLLLRSGDVLRASFERKELPLNRLTAEFDVRMALSKGRLDDADAHLAVFEKAGQSVPDRIILNLLRARIALARDQETDAVAHLRRAVDYGRRDRFVQVFAEDLPQLEPAMRRLVAGFDDPYPFSLLAAVVAPRPRRPVKVVPPTDVEPLSEREQIVLRYLPTVLSNKKMAAELHMSVNTLKTHLKSIYRKLHAGSRDEAVLQARKLHLL